MPLAPGTRLDPFEIVAPLAITEDGHRTPVFDIHITDLAGVNTVGLR